MFKKIKIYYLRLKSKILTPRINRDIKKYKYVHVMKNDKFNKPFADFINKNFDSSEHMILCYKSNPDKAPTIFPKGKNVYEYVYFKDIKGLLGDNIDKIIFHSLFMPGAVDRLYREPELLKKSYWVIWGGDLYNAPRDEKNDFVRKKFKGYIGDTKQNILKEIYGVTKKIYNAWYTFPISLEMLENVLYSMHKCKRIQINNSCDESTLEMLDILSKFKDENIKITTVLSYGKLEYKEQIIKKGKTIYGEKFEYLDKLMSPEEYINYLVQNDILILNQNRQQGFGNIIASLYLEKKVYIRSDVSTYNYLKDYDIKINDSKNIENDINSFLHNDSKENNKEKVKIFFNKQEQKLAWSEVFLEK